ALVVLTAAWPVGYMVVTVVKLLLKGHPLDLTTVTADRSRVSRKSPDAFACLLRRPEKFGPIFGRGFRGEAVTHDVFGDNAWDEEVEQVIAAAGFGSAAAHFESAKRMAADHRASAGAIDINIPGYELGFDPLDVSGTAREESGGERVIGIVGNSDRVVQIARFQHTQHRSENFTLAYGHFRSYAGKTGGRNEIAFFRYVGRL